MAYITTARAIELLVDMGMFPNFEFEPSDIQSGNIQRATDRIEMLHFETDKAVPDRTAERFTMDNVPSAIQRATALLAAWYAETPLLYYDLLHDDKESSMSPQVSDMFMMVQSMLWPYLAGSVQSNSVEQKKDNPKNRTPAYSLG